MIIIFERDIIKEHISSFSSIVFWSVMTLAGIFGFLIGIVTIAQISLTSPLTHNISGTAKACVHTIIAVLFLGDKMSLRSVFGTTCVLFGTFMYSVVRNYEMDQKKKNSPEIKGLAKPEDDPEEDPEGKPLLTKREQSQV